MIKWFLIGCAIVGSFTSAGWLWKSLSEQAKDVVEDVMGLAVASAVVGFVAWIIFGGAA